MASRKMLFGTINSVDLLELHRPYANIDYSNRAVNKGR